MNRLNPTTNMKTFLLIATASIFTLSLIPMDASGAKGAKGPMHKPKPTPVPEKINASGAKITKVGGDSITIEYSKTSTTYKMTNETQININGKRGGSADLKPGMLVEIGKSDLKPGVLLSIQATTPPTH